MSRRGATFIPLNASLQPMALDDVLAHGWYRMRQHIFTTGELEFDDGSTVPVNWLRLRLGAYGLPHRYSRIERRCRRFSCSLQPWRITAETQALFEAYCSDIDFQTGPSVASILLEQHSPDNFFPTQMWELRDGDRLIGVSYFDLGNTSGAGILSFYHPDYKACSPGLYLYLQSVRHCLELKKEFFYPGYIAVGWSKFDYKLLAGHEHMEVWHADSCQWKPYAGSVHERWSALGAHQAKN